MKTVMGLINIQEDNNLIRELTASRAVELIPFAGRYRMVDFTLSCMVNAGIGHVGIMLPDNPRSVLDHVRSGKEWDLSRRHQGLFYLPSVRVAKEAREGDLKNFYANADFFRHSDKQYILLTGGSFIYNMDYSEILRFHKSKDADITMVYYTAQAENNGRDAVLQVEENGKVKDIAEKPATYGGSKVSMGIYFMEKEVFVDLIKTAYEHGGQDFLVDAIIRHSPEHSIYAFEHKGYVSHVESMAAYYRTNMDMLTPDVWEELFMRGRSIYTKVKDEVPVQYKEDAKISNSIIANGSEIHGEVDNSVLFRGVKIGKGAKVKNSIIMEKCDIRDGAVIENAVCDKNCIVSKDKWLRGAPNYPIIVTKNTTI